MLYLEHGKPMIFGKNRDKGIRLNGLNPEVVTIGENGITEDDMLVHDAHAEDPTSRSSCRACSGPSSRCRSASSATSSGRPTPT